MIAAMPEDISLRTVGPKYTIITTWRFMGSYSVTGGVKSKATTVTTGHNLI